MKIVVIHDGPPDHALALTSIIPGLRRAYGQYAVKWLTGPKNAVFFRHLPCVEVVDINAKLPDVSYDIVINYGGSATAITKSSLVKADRHMGMFDVDNRSEFLDEHGEIMAHVLYKRQQTKRNIFQVFYGMAGLKWRGESYAFRYFPRTKVKEGNTGIAVQDEAVRDYLKRSLGVSERKLWNIPFRQDPLKQFDEINYCENVITDNPFIMHGAVCLRKHVEYLTYDVPNMKFEFFGKGHHHVVSEDARQLALASEG